MDSRRKAKPVLLNRNLPYHATTTNRAYRLIDGRGLPHPQLDSNYSSIDEALADAISWIQTQGARATSHWIGIEVSTPCGSWRTIHQPDMLLCPWPA
jgi:hypothetical protein